MMKKRQILDIQHETFSDMRLWHQHLLKHLDRKRLLGQHRECCALRGKGWRKKHSTVDYVFKHDLAHLYAYHCLVMKEMLCRGYHVDAVWYARNWRGKALGYCSLLEIGTYVHSNEQLVYEEHDDKYLKECLENLQSKDAELMNGTSINEQLLKLAARGVV